MRNVRGRMASMAALAAVATTVLVFGGPPAPVGAATACTITWTGAAGGLWSAAGSWTPATGPARTPVATDVVCTVDDAPAGTVDAPFTVAELRWTVSNPVSLVVTSSLTVTGRGDVGTLRLAGGSTLTADVFVVAGATTVPASATAATVGTTTGFQTTGLTVAGTLDATGWTYLDGTTRVSAGGAVRLGDPAGNPNIPPLVHLRGTLDLRDGGTFANVGPIDLRATETARILGPPPTFRRSRINLAGPVSVVATAGSQVGTIAAGAVLRVVPDPGSGDDLEIPNLAPIEGTLVLDGSPGQLVVVDGQGGTIENEGTIEIDNAVVAAPLQNRRLVRMGGGATFVYHRQSIEPHRNQGYLVMTGPGGFSGELENTGAIGTDGPAGELLIDDVLVVGGVVDAPVRVVDSGGIRAVVGAQTPVRRLDLTDRGQSGVQVNGHTSSTAGTVRSSSTVDISTGRHIWGLYDMGDGYVPCHGDRFPVVTSRGLRQDGRVVADGGQQGYDRGRIESGLIEYQTRSWGIVAQITLETAPSSWCRLAVGRRFTLLAHTEALRRLPTNDELAWHEPSARTEEGQVGVARRLLATVEASRVLADGEYGRIVGSPADAAGLDYWGRELAAGTQPRVLRAQLLGSAAFYRQAGSTPGGFADALFRSELGRPVDAGTRTWIEARLASGRTRAQVARDVIVSAEGRHALAGRLITRWWGRAGTRAERVSWGDRLVGAPERNVASRLAAAAPGT